MQKSAHQKIVSLIKQVKLEKFFTSEIELRQYNYETTVIKNNQKIKLLVYFGKKGVKAILQGNTSTKEYTELNKIISGNYSMEFKEEEKIDFEDYIGTDETGKGDYFGPLVIAGFYANKENKSFLAEIGVRDSKELTDYQIDNIAIEIKSEFPKNFSIVSIHPEKYNQLYEKFKNLNKLLNWGHSKVIEILFNNFAPKNVIVDKFSKEPLNVSLEQNFANVNFVQIPKAEKYLGVAAASIIARNEMNSWFRQKQKQGYNVLKGASSEVENAAKNIFAQSDKLLMSKFVKLHFKTSKKIFED